MNDYTVVCDRHGDISTHDTCPSLINYCHRCGMRVTIVNNTKYNTYALEELKTLETFSIQEVLDRLDTEHYSLDEFTEAAYYSINSVKRLMRSLKAEIG